MLIQDNNGDQFEMARPTRKSKGKGKMPTHIFLPNGLVEVNPYGQHPIYDLLETGKAIWEGKLKRASKTFGEAVNEYRRRYGRAPPKGFDRW